MIPRSDVERGRRYSEYRAEVRWDFWYSCGYCTATECEFGPRAFQIDHYEPCISNPNLEHEFTNLIWACSDCNGFKSDWDPPANARANGFEFFRPDVHEAVEHFDLEGDALASKTSIGRFTIQLLYLNRETLRRVRRIREDLYGFRNASIEGLRALAGLPLDAVPKHNRAQFLRVRTKLNQQFQTIDDAIVRELSRSPIVADPAPAPKERKTYLDTVRALHPGTWRGRDAKGNAPRPKRSRSRKRAGARRRRR